MFVGHYSAALVAAAHPKAPRLGTLFVAAQLMDLGFFTFVLTGTEHMRLTPGFTVMNNMDLYDMPLTHSLLGAGGLALVFGIAVALWLRSRMAGAIAGTVVVSHWVLDLLVHAPDLTLAGSPPKLGLGLWNCPAIEMPLEIGLLFASAWLFSRGKAASELAVGCAAGCAACFSGVQLVCASANRTRRQSVHSWAGRLFDRGGGCLVGRPRLVRRSGRIGG
ncbi:MAG: hypothetical protein IPO97_15475 [Sphingomonadales bacterium]|nr:hypothetical protein [Sphingomonadales bacterium]